MRISYCKITGDQCLESAWEKGAALKSALGFEEGCAGWKKHKALLYLPHNPHESNPEFTCSCWWLSCIHWQILSPLWSTQPSLRYKICTYLSWLKWNQIVHRDGLIIQVNWWVIRIQFFLCEFYIKTYMEKVKMKRKQMRLQ